MLTSVISMFTQNVYLCNKQLCFCSGLVKDVGECERGLEFSSVLTNLPRSQVGKHIEISILPKHQMTLGYYPLKFWSHPMGQRKFDPGGV